MKKEQMYHLICESLKIKDFNYLDYQEIFPIIELLDDSKYKLIGQGSYSNVYKIGNIVIKIGLAKIDERIIFNSNLITIYYKHNLRIKVNNCLLKIGIEIQEYANEACPTKEEMFILYKKLRDDGIIWGDVKPSNTGMINKRLIVTDTDFVFVKKMPNELILKNEIDREFYIRYNKDSGDEI